MVLPILIGAGIIVTGIIGTVIVIDSIDARSQRYKLTIKRKITKPDGSIIEDEYTLEFKTQQEMIDAAKNASSICGVDYAIEK